MNFVKHTLLILLSCATLWSCRNAEQPFKMIDQVDFSHVKITDNFWSPRLKDHATNTLAVCIDQIENQTGRIRNFENAAKGEGKHSGIFFDDSDVYKALEGIAYSLMNHPDAELEKKADEWIDKFAAAQQPDGYINTFYTLTGLDKRWQNMDKHEMYCAGHMIEAAVAYYQATGKRKLLDVSTKMANHMMDIFGPNKRHWVPGHEEIELALVKLYSVTKDQRYLDFSDWLLEERGHGYGSKGGEGNWNSKYYQDDMPVREMSKIGGHAVRAMYLFCGMADVAALKKDTGYIEALNRLWDDVVLRKMYVTGGIGSSRHNEGFTEDYDLPNYDAYCETCASVGMVFWNSRMNLLTGDSKYVDVLERSMYNGALAGVSLAGDRFFYVNPLASMGNHHRQEWYGCACCPSQVSRFLPSIGNYIYGISKDAIWVNLYMGNTAEFYVEKNKINIKQETSYPWEGSVNLTIGNISSPLKKEIRLRIPGWCKNYSIAVNGKTIDTPEFEKGYAVLGKKWKTGDQITLHFDMPVEVVAADSRVKEDIGKRAIQRGPLVYCMEQTDNPNDFENLKLSSDMKFSNSFSSMLNGVMCIKASDENREVNFIPYYAWDNREAGEMKVWIDYIDKEACQSSSPPSKWSDQKLNEWFESGQFLNGLQMIPDPSVDRRSFAQHYCGHQETWDKAFSFLKNADFAKMALGRVELGGNMFATVSEYLAKNRESTLLEVHQKYIDIQYVVSGNELIDVAPLKNMTVAKPYDSENDIAFGNVSEFSALKASSGRFFIFFPTDVHRPGMKDGNGNVLIRKVVVKVPVE